MNTATATAFNTFLSTLTAAQRAAFLNMAGMHIENEETNDEDGDAEAALESEGHVFLVGLRDATILAINA
jgi:hypothetical protein